jgi:Tfp pilus assembly protein FimT
MKRIEPKEQLPRSSERGFSIVELVVVIGMILVLSAVAIINVSSSLKAAAADSASQLIVQEMRLARQYAISDRRIYRLTFTAPQSISLNRMASDSVTLDPSPNDSTSVVPQTVAFQCEPGVPTTPSTVPNGIGNGAIALDLGVADNNFMFFYPDGAGRDVLGRIANGVVYTSVSGQLASARAVTVFGSTGSIKSWKLVNVGGNWQWQ